MRGGRGTVRAAQLASIASRPEGHHPEARVILEVRVIHVSARGALGFPHASQAGGALRFSMRHTAGGALRSPPLSSVCVILNCEAVKDLRAATASRTPRPPYFSTEAGTMFCTGGCCLSAKMSASLSSVVMPA